MVNRGISFGWWQGIPVWVVIAVLGVVVVFFVKARRRWERVGLGLVMIGGGGNIVQRLVYGGVVDPLRLGPYLSNNVWDYLIALGVVVYSAALYRDRQR